MGMSESTVITKFVEDLALWATTSRSVKARRILRLKVRSVSVKKRKNCQWPYNRKRSASS